MGDVRALPGHVVPLQSGESDPDIVGALEELLEKAKAGRLNAFAWCSYSTVDQLSHGWMPGTYAFHLGSAILSLNYEYGKALSGDDK